jgi:hypothetical protein
MGIEEPAAFMGSSQIMAFAKLMQHHIQELGGTQFFATTTNNALIDQTDPINVWFLLRDIQGSVRASRGLDELQFFNVDLNSVGPYWYSQHLYTRQDADESLYPVAQKSAVMANT